jgi:hypothetical protein
MKAFANAPQLSEICGVNDLNSGFFSGDSESKFFFFFFTRQLENPILYFEKCCNSIIDINSHRVQNGNQPVQGIFFFQPSLWDENNQYQSVGSWEC